MMRLFISLITAVTISSQLSASPLPLGVMAVVFTILMLGVTLSLMTSMVTMLIFLIYIGGLMVMFSYFLSIQPNTVVNVWPMTTSFLTSFLLMQTTNEGGCPQPATSVSDPSSIMLSTNIDTILILTLSLLFTLIIVNSLTSKKDGPMRPYST